MHACRQHRHFENVISCGVPFITLFIMPLLIASPVVVSTKLEMSHRHHTSRLCTRQPGLGLAERFCRSVRKRRANGVSRGPRHHLTASSMEQEKANLQKSMHSRYISIAAQCRLNVCQQMPWHRLQHIWTCEVHNTAQMTCRTRPQLHCLACTHVQLALTRFSASTRRDMT